MTHASLDHLITIAIPHAAMCKAIAIAHPRNGGPDRARLIVIANAHGGATALAEALELRLGLIGLLHQIDPMVVRPNSVRTEDLARVLVELPLSVRNGVLEFDGDDFANRLRLASAALGHA